MTEINNARSEAEDEYEGSEEYEIFESIDEIHENILLDWQFLTELWK